jgi:hypothetical protein
VCDEINSSTRRPRSPASSSPSKGGSSSIHGYSVDRVR